MCFISWAWAIAVLILSLWEDAFSEGTKIGLAASGLFVIMVIMPAVTVVGWPVFRSVRSRFRWLIVPACLGPPAIVCGTIAYLIVTQ